jgi:hypothetical protein
MENMEDREQTIHERIKGEIDEKVRKLLSELQEADDKGDKEAADRVVDELVRLVETYGPWMIGKGKTTPVQEAIWAIRLAKSPGLWDTLREIFLGETPYEREERKKLQRKREYYNEVKVEMRAFLSEFKRIVSSLHQKYQELGELLSRAKTKSGEPFPWEVKRKVWDRLHAAGVLELALESGRELNPAFIMNIHKESVDVLADRKGLTDLESKIGSLISISYIDQSHSLLTEITRLTWNFIDALGRMRQVGFLHMSISPEEVGETQKK